MRAAANFVSVIFHPVFVPSITFISIFFGIKDKDLIFHPIDFYGIFVYTLCIPLIVVIVLRIGNFISSIYLTSRRERIYVFVCIVIMSISLFMTERASFSLLTKSFLQNLFLILLVLIVLTSFIRVSIHSVAIWGAIRFIWDVSFLPFDGSFKLIIASSLLIAGLIMASRLYLNKHKPNEIYLGALIGLTCFIY